jgi:hypothetical protein
LQCEVEDNEYNYHKLLRELELKEMQINTLEQMLNRKDDELDKVRETQAKMKSLTMFNTSEMNFRSGDFNSSNEFVKSEDKERELNRLVGGNYYRAESAKIPGKIYSKKKI